jgi:hypothetical protein
VKTDTNIPYNKPNIIIRNNEEGTRLLIDTAISGDRNTIKKEAEKILNYKDLKIEIQRMWNVKTEVITIIYGGKWKHLKLIQKIAEQHNCKAKIKEIHKTAILGTAQVLRKVLM